MVTDPNVALTRALTALYDDDRAGSIEYLCTLSALLAEPDSLFPDTVSVAREFVRYASDADPTTVMASRWEAK